MTIGEDMYCFPSGVLILGNCLLVTDNITKCLHKFRLESHSAKLIWTCKDLDSPTGICVDKHGLIYVASEEGGVIYLVSPEGKLTCAFPCTVNLSENLNFFQNFFKSAAAFFFKFPKTLPVEQFSKFVALFLFEN